MAIFPSDDWLQAYCRAFADHPEAGASAETLRGL
jgi:hypothetical protein